DGGVCVSDVAAKAEARGVYVAAYSFDEYAGFLLLGSLATYFTVNTPPRATSATFAARIASLIDRFMFLLATYRVRAPSSFASSPRLVCMLTTICIFGSQLGQKSSSFVPNFVCCRSVGSLLM